jgi:hypothetical protein
MVKYKECKICGLTFPYTTGKFTSHLMEEHNITLRDYIIKYELSGNTPKCQCGYCDEDAPFFRGKFLDRIGDHQKYEWLKEQYIKKYGKPTCKTCGEDVKWHRGIPNSYCSAKCIPNNWNQEKINKTIKEKYGVDNVSFLYDVRKKISDNMKSKIFDFKNNFKIKKYKKTKLYYQSLYEYDFLEHCEKLNILDKVENGNVYNFLLEDTNFGFRTITDFCIGDTEIEIKSTYILEKQGGQNIIEIKRRAVESDCKKYLLILDKKYSEFDKYLKIIN